MVVEGKTAELSVELRSTNPDPTTSPKPSPSRVVPGVALAGGALLLSFSGYALYRATTSDDKFTYEHATPIAAVTGIVGLGAISTGLYLLWRGSDTSAPTVKISPRNAVAGWVWRY
jgi:multisubunit Na+/H+ antiporter MnhB subunit